MNAQHLRITGPNSIEAHSFQVDERLGHGEALIQVSHSLISPGTELSILAGSPVGVTRGLGYTAVGTIIADGGGIDPALKNRPVFLFPAFTDQ